MTQCFRSGRLWDAVPRAERTGSAPRIRPAVQSETPLSCAPPTATPAPDRGERYPASREARLSLSRPAASSVGSPLMSRPLCRRVGVDVDGRCAVGADDRAGDGGGVRAEREV